MATDKKHIAVYLDKAVEDALIEFCTANGLEGKKGPMYSAAVNKALAQYFKLGSTAPSTTPDIAAGSIPKNTLDNTLDTISGNTLEQRLAELEQRLAEQMAAMKEEILGEYAA